MARYGSNPVPFTEDMTPKPQVFNNANGNGFVVKNSSWVNVEGFTGRCFAREFISADDTADLYLSTDATPANKRVIAQQPGWNSNRQWVSDAGGGLDLQQKTSNTWTNGVGATPYATGIHLLAGTQYYIEGVMNEFGGGDNLAVTFYNSATESPPTDLDAPRLTGSLIGVNVTSATTLTFTTQPQSTTAFAGTLA